MKKAVQEEGKKRLEEDRTRCFATHDALYARGVEVVCACICAYLMCGVFARNGSGRARLLAYLTKINRA